MKDHLDLPELAWRRISPKFLIEEFFGLLVVAVVVVGVGLVFFFTDLRVPAIIAAGFFLGLVIYAAFTPRRVRSIGYQLREDDLVFRRGILFQRFVAVPYGRMQLVDINRGPLSRILGLSELKFVTAAASTGVTIPGIPSAEADELRDRIVALAETRRAGL